MPVNRTVPVTFSDDRSESAIRIPTTPPAENAPFHGLPERTDGERGGNAQEQHDGAEYLDAGGLDRRVSGSISRPAAKAERAG